MATRLLAVVWCCLELSHGMRQPHRAKETSASFADEGQGGFVRGNFNSNACEPNTKLDSENACRKAADVLGGGVYFGGTVNRTDRPGGCFQAMASLQWNENKGRGKKLVKPVCWSGAGPAPTLPPPTKPPTPAPTPPSTKKKIQYTPDQADWDNLNSMPLSQGNTTAHDPDSFGYYRGEFWKPWDGKVIDPTRMSRTAFHEAICPSGGVLAGLREVFYWYKPFADNKNPTKAEVDDWNRVVLNHARALVGRNTSEWHAVPDKCLFLQTQWGDERKFTKKWDRKYPASRGRDKGPMWGPCGENAKPHCGNNFVPDPKDQKPYLPRGQKNKPCKAASRSEGILLARAHHNWAMRFSWTICKTIKDEGPCGGHVGPLFRRTHFGLAFALTRPDLPHSFVNVRGNWAGTLKDSFAHC